MPEREKDQDMEAPKTKSGGKLVLIIVLVNTLVLAAVGAYLAMSHFSPPAEDGSAELSTPTHKWEEPGPQHSLGEFVVNLNEAGGDRFLRCKVVVELNGTELEEEMKIRRIQLRDRIITYLSSLRFVDTQGLSGKEEIRRGIRSRINALLKSGRIEAVYFSEFVVQ